MRHKIERKKGEGRGSSSKKIRLNKGGKLEFFGQREKEERSGKILKESAWFPGVWRRGHNGRRQPGAAVGTPVGQRVSALSIRSRKGKRNRG